MKNTTANFFPSLMHIRLFILAILLSGVNASGLMAQNTLLDRFYSGEYKSVIGESTEAIQSGDTAYNTFYLLALSQVQMGLSEEAIETLGKALVIFPDDPRIHRMLAGQLFEAGNYPDAQTYYANLVATDSGDIAAWIKLADIASFRQQYKEAIRIHEHIISLDSTNMNSLVQMGDILTRNNNEDAVFYYEDAYFLYPDNQKVAYALGNWYIKAEEHRRTVKICKNIIAKDSLNIRFQKLLGFAYYKMGVTDSSKNHFVKATVLGDSTAFTFKYLGIAHYLTFSIPEAEHALSLSLEKDSMDAEVHFFLGASLANTKEKERALKHLDKSIEIMKPDPAVSSRIYSEKGNIKRLQMEYDEAYLLYSQAWETDTTNIASLYFMASILDNSLHKSKEALVDYQHYIDKLNSSPPAVQSSRQVATIREIVEDRIISLKEELFFLDE